MLIEHFCLPNYFKAFLSFLHFISSILTELSNVTITKIFDQVLRDNSAMNVGAVSLSIECVASFRFIADIKCSEGIYDVSKSH